MFEEDDSDRQVRYVNAYAPVPLRIILTKMRVREANCHA